MSPLLIGVAATSVLSFAFGAGVAWQIQSQKILTLEKTYAEQQLTSERATAAQASAAATRVITAQSQAAAHVSVIRTDSDAAVAAGNGLRVSSTEAMRTAQASLDACTALNAKYDNVLSEAISEAQSLAGAADGWELDAVMLQGAWPR